MRNQRTPKELLADLDFIQSSKVSTSQASPFFSGIVYEIILNKEIIKTNKQLPDFVNGIIIDTANKAPKINNNLVEIAQLKSYIFASRTSVAARTSRIILENFEYPTIEKVIANIVEYIERTAENKEISKPTLKKQSVSDSLDSWLGRK